MLQKNEFRVQIWDTAGQERYRGMTPMYFRGADAALLVYSVDDPQSFEAIDFWVKSLKEHGEPNVSLFLVGNKCDLEDERAVVAEEAEGKAARIGALFYEVSAQTGDRVEDVFVDVCKLHLEKGAPPETAPTETIPLDGKEGCC
jgi:small GTP-binding protein